MSADDTSDDDANLEKTDGSDECSRDVRETLEENAGRAIEQFDEGVIDLLSWILETETRARIYIRLRQQPGSTSDEIAAGTGLYPSTVREALAALHEDAIVERDKRKSDGAGNNPYEYSAISPSELVSEILDDMQGHLNAVFNLDQYLEGSEREDAENEPVTITVTEENENGTVAESEGDHSETNHESKDDSDDSETDDA
jgi:predicted transcriptional regulator